MRSGVLVVACMALLSVANAALRLEHSLGDGGAFVAKAAVQVRANQTSLPLVFEGQAPWTHEQQDNLVELARADGSYRVRIVSDGRADVVASVRACELAAGGLKHWIGLHITQASLARALAMVESAGAGGGAHTHETRENASANLLTPDVVGMDLLVRVPYGSGCAATPGGRAGQMSSALSALLAAQAQRAGDATLQGPTPRARGKVLVPETAQQVPASPATRGWPYPNMRAEGTQGRQGGKDAPEAPPTFWQQYGGYIVPVLIAYAVMSLLSGSRVLQRVA